MPPFSPILSSSSVHVQLPTPNLGGDFTAIENAILLTSCAVTLYIIHRATLTLALVEGSNGPPMFFRKNKLA